MSRRIRVITILKFIFLNYYNETGKTASGTPKANIALHGELPPPPSPSRPFPLMLPGP
jgi:hypothetical protein